MNIDIKENHCTYVTGNTDQSWQVWIDGELSLSIDKRYDEKFYTLCAYHVGDGIPNESKWLKVFENEISHYFRTQESVVDAIKNKLNVK